MPDYLYRGLEKMTAITVRSVLIKAFFTAAIFAFLKQPGDYYVVPLLNIIGNGAALLGVYIHLYRHLHIRFGRVSRQEYFPGSAAASPSSTPGSHPLPTRQPIPLFSI